MKTLNYLKHTLKEFQHAPAMFGKAIAKITGCIDELEALNARSCASCKHFAPDTEFNDGFGQCFYSIHFPNSSSTSYHENYNYCSEYESKDNK